MPPNIQVYRIRVANHRKVKQEYKTGIMTCIASVTGVTTCSIIIIIITCLTHISRYVSRYIPGIYPNSHTSIYKLAKGVIGNSGCINELCLQWVPYIPGTTVQGCSVAWKRKPAARLIQEEGLMYAR